MKKMWVLIPCSEHQIIVNGTNKAWAKKNGSSPPMNNVKLSDNWFDVAHIIKCARAEGFTIYRWLHDLPVTPRTPCLVTCGFIDLIRLRTRQNFELVHIIGPVQNFGPPARNFGPLRAEFAWREWRKTLGGHVANWAGLSGFSPRENKISHTFFIDFINKYSKVSNAHNSDDCHGVFNGGMWNKGWSFSRSRFDCLGLMHFFHG